MTRTGRASIFFTALVLTAGIAFAQIPGGGGGAPSGPAGGGLTGTYPNPTVATVPATALPALTGDVTSSAGSAATTVVKINGATPGPAATAAAGQIPGTATNDNACAGCIGEYASSIVLSGSAVAVSTGVAKDITTLTLSAGDWDVSGICATQPAGGTTTSQLICNITTTANTLNNVPSDGGAFGYNNTAVPASAGESQSTDVARVSISGSTTYHLVTSVSFAVSTMGAYGKIRARRVR